MNIYKVVRNEKESKIVKSVLSFSDFNKTVFSGYMIEQLNDLKVCIKIGFGMNENLTECDLFNVLKKVEVKKPAIFTSTIIETVILSFIKQGLKINQIRAKLRRFASQSQLCKMYHKLVKSMIDTVKNTIVVTKCTIANCLKIVSNNTTTPAKVLKVNTIHHVTHINTFASIYGFKVAVL